MTTSEIILLCTTVFQILCLFSMIFCVVAMLAFKKKWLTAFLCIALIALVVGVAGFALSAIWSN